MGIYACDAQRLAVQLRDAKRRVRCNRSLSTSTVRRNRPGFSVGDRQRGVVVGPRLGSPVRRNRTPSRQCTSVGP
jgi:hypothetical protein